MQVQIKTISNKRLHKYAGVYHSNVLPTMDDILENECPPY